MLILAFDTATPFVTVALHDGARVVGRFTGEGPMQHGELLAPGIAAVLAQAGADRRDLTDVAVGVGPGPYTGLRVGVVTARTLAGVLPVRAVGVCSLDVLAAGARASGVTGGFVAASDARRKEVYWARYDAGGARVEGPSVLRPAELAGRLDSGEGVVGRGAQLYADVLPVIDAPVDPDAGVLCALVAHGGCQRLPMEPLYLRRPDATEPAARRRVS